MPSVFLLLDSSTANSAWAFIRAGELVAGGNEIAPPSASVTLAAHLEAIFREHKELLSELAGVYVGTGPGSFTGLRVALALGKGIAYASHVPLRGFSSLLAIAYSAWSQKPKAPYVAAIIDAKKSEIYGALYQAKDGELQEVIAPKAYNPAAFSMAVANKLNGDKVLLCGTGLSLVQIDNSQKLDIAATADGLAKLLNILPKQKMDEGFPSEE